MNEHYLSDIAVGKKAVVKEVLLGGSIRRRLFDIGLINGTQVVCLGQSPFGDPKAYFIRGAVIALRQSDSKQILIEGD